MLLQNVNKISPYDYTNTITNDPDKVYQKVQILNQWLVDNPNINACTDFENLSFFLRSCKYDVDRTMKKIKCFYQMRAERSEWFANRDPFLKEVQECLELGVFLPVDGIDVEKRKVVVVRTSAHDPKLHLQNNVFKVSKMILDILLKMEPENCARGIVAIFDMRGVQLGHALQLNPKLIKRSVESWQSYPCQPKSLEFVNTPVHVNLILNTFRLFMTNKMKSRVIVQKKGCSVKSTHLPIDLGGTGPSYAELSLKWKRIVEENANFFVEDNKFKSILNVKK